jgi:DNA invertase Pin-like site-specific DNA recombinase
VSTCEGVLKQRICRGRPLSSAAIRPRSAWLNWRRSAILGRYWRPNSGARADRPTLAQVLDQLRPGDTLVVWKLDRLGRSLRHLVDTITEFAERGIGFRSLHEAIDTTTPGGKLVFHVLAALAEVERDLIRERAAAGLAAAWARGRHGGPAVGPERPSA